MERKCLIFIKENYSYSNSTKVEELKNEVSNLLSQFSSAMNLRQKKLISNFIDYYADDNSIFQKKSILLDSYDSSTVKAERVYKLNKAQYIEHLHNIVSAPLRYAFTAQITSFDFDQRHISAIVGVAIEETAIMKANANMNLKMVISTNCNFAFNLQQLPPYILSNNCIEKILIK
ncbi:MAG: hypothetical protein AB8V23_01680 [Candidatus Midichloria sp.]|nr:hypothetical protein MHYMCMPSP_00527 [Hyalomma marginatum]